MACTVNYNKNKKIDSVLTAQGERSKLFDQLAKLPHMENLEQALETYKNVYAPKFYSLIGEKGASRVQKFKDSLELAKKLEKEGKDFSETGWFKENNQWKYFNYETLKNIKFTLILQILLSKLLTINKPWISQVNQTQMQYLMWVKKRYPSSEELNMTYVEMEMYYRLYSQLPKNKESFTRFLTLYKGSKGFLVAEMFKLFFKRAILLQG